MQTGHLTQVVHDAAIAAAAIMRIRGKSEAQQQSAGEKYLHDGHFGASLSDAPNYAGSVRS
jgi:hypothetical protein